MPLKSGPLSREELLDVWRGAVDVEYARSIEEAGYGEGFEVPGQAAEQLARVSRAIDTSTQALYIRPWSGQSGEPAQGEARAQVTLSISRSLRLERPLVLGVGTPIAHEEVDWGDEGGIDYRSGLRYLLAADLVFHPGETGPFDVVATAERSGWNYNDPLPGTIKAIDQPGSDFTNNRASVVIVAEPVPSTTPPFKSATLVSENQPDMPVPEHVGQHFLFMAGANIGKIGRAIVFGNPNPPLEGSSVELEIEASLFSGTFTGTFTVGEVVSFDAGGPVLGYGKLLGARDAGGVRRITVRMLTGAVAANVLGTSSSATMTASTVPYLEDVFVVESSAAEWRVLDWENDFGLVVTNVLSPAGGRLGMLDAIGDERGVNRAPGEQDDSYRARVAEIADVVSPNAIKRTLNRVLGTIPWCFREVGYPELPGMFYDGNNEPADVSPHGGENDAYDMDAYKIEGGPPVGTFYFQEASVLEDGSGGIAMTGWMGGLSEFDTVVDFIRGNGRPPASVVGYRVRGLFSGATFPVTLVRARFESTRFRCLFDYTEFRAFFLIGVPRLAMGEFGYAYDAGPYNAYDVAPFNAFFDGFPRTAADIYRHVYQAVDVVKAGGVGFGLYLIDEPCGPVPRP